MNRQRVLIPVAMTILLLVAAPPAKADLSMGEITHAIRNALEDWFRLIVTRAGSLPDVLLRQQLDELIAAIGEAADSYLPKGADLSRMFPDVPDLDTPDAISAHAEQRNDDRKARVEEAMTVAAGVTAAIPADQVELTALQGLNASPASIFAALQIGNQIALGTANALEKQNALIAELGQVDADQHAQEDWSRRQQDLWDRGHYGSDGYWQGMRSWTPEILAERW